MFVVGEYWLWYGGGVAENIQTETKEHKLEYGMQIGFVLLKLKRNLVSMKESNWEFIGGEKLSTKLVGVCSGKVFTAPVVGGGGNS